MSRSKLPRPFGTLEQELQIAAKAMDAVHYVPAIETRNDITNSIPGVAVLVVGNDDRVTAALANELRVYMEQHLNLPTVPLANLTEASNYVDFEETRDEHADSNSEYKDLIVEGTSRTIWDGMCNAYPAIRRLQMRVGVEIIKGDVQLSKEVVQSALVQIGDDTLVDQRSTTFYP